jgi:NADH-ubiquinone oxidoreductase chain 2
MVLSAALDNGYIFLSFIAILTSVIGAVYYLSLIKEIFFFSVQPVQKRNPLIVNRIVGRIYGGAKSSNQEERALIESMRFNTDNIAMSSGIAVTISTITLLILLFIFINKE